MKICLVGSSGGLLTHLYMRNPFWSDHERFWVTFDKEEARSLLKEETVYLRYFPTNRNVKNLIRNTSLAWKVLRKDIPELIISSGAAVPVPFSIWASSSVQRRSTLCFPAEPVWRAGE